MAKDSSATPTATTTPSQDGPSDDCHLAVLAWSDLAKLDLISAGSMTSFSVDGRNVPTNKIEVHCSQEILGKAAEANYELAVLNAQLTICENIPENCDAAKVRAGRDKASAVVDAVDAMVAD